MHSPPIATRWSAPPFVSASVGLHAEAAGTVAFVPDAAWWALGGVALNQAGLTAAGLWPRSALLGPNHTRLPDTAARRGGFALTLDDGPDPAVTPQVLDLLDAHGAKATFFCIAERARTHAPLVRSMVERGHDVQNHSHRHRHHFALLGPAALAREIGNAQETLADITGVRPHCFRAPAGLRNPFLDPVLHHQDLHLVSWTRRGFDTTTAEARRVLQRLTAGLAAGDIVMLHDGHARRSALGLPVVLEVLPALLRRCREAGLRTVTLREALPLRSSAPQ